MITAKAYEDVVPDRFEDSYNGLHYARTNYFGCDTSPADSPQGFLIEQSPQSTVQPHFHGVNQFQVVVRGDGMLGRHELHPICLHYTAANTGYGPIRAHDDWLFYFTLRMQSEPGAHFLPADRSLQKPGRRRNLTTAVPLASDASQPRWTTLFEPQADGMAASLVELPGDAHTTAPAPGDSSGQYVLVLEGALSHEGRVLPQWTCVLVPPDGQGMPLQAGPDGLAALVLQYPRVEAAA